MSWFNKHLNWTYGFIIVLSFIISAGVIPFLLDNPSVHNPAFWVGSLLSLVLILGGSIWILRKKGQSLWFLALIVVISLALIVLALALPNNRTGQNEGRKISEADYYKNRDTGVK